MISCLNTKKCFSTQGSPLQVKFRAQRLLTFCHRHRHDQIYYRNFSPSLRKDVIKQQCTSGGILVSPFWKRLYIKLVECPCCIIYNVINKRRHSIHHDHAFAATHAVSEGFTLSTHETWISCLSSLAHKKSSLKAFKDETRVKKTECRKLHPRLDGFGGLVVRMLASGSPVRGFKPGRSRWIFLYIKILSISSFGGEVK
jgi:hypothetical protein